MGKIVAMLVDQQEFLRTELQKALVQGTDVTSIEIIQCDPGLDGNEAVAQIDTLSPDVMLLDINFPYRDGLALCRKIVRKTPQTKVVMLTSKSSPFDRIRGTLAGCDTYLTKPVDRAQLKAIADRHLRRAAQRDAAASRAGRVAA